MKIKRRVSSLEEVPEELRGLYTKQTDSQGEEFYTLPLDDTEFKQARNQNIDLQKQKKQLEEQLEAVRSKYSQYDGVDLEQYKVGQQLLSQIEDDKEREMLQKGQYEDVVKRRMTRANREWEEKFSAKDKAVKDKDQTISTLRKQLSNLKIESELGDAINALGVAVPRSALPDVRHRVTSVFQVTDDGKTIARNKDGEMLRDTQGDPMGIKQYLSDLHNEAPHLFGGGASGGGAGGNTSTKPISTSGVRTVKKSDFKARQTYHKEIQAGTVKVVPD